MGPHRISSYRFGLRGKILASVALWVMLTAAAVGFYLLQRSREILRSKVYAALSGHVEQRRSRVRDWLSQRQHDAGRYAASFIVYEGLDSVSREGRDTTRVKRDLEFFLRSIMAHHREYESLLLLDRRGAIVATTRDEQLEPWIVELVAKATAGADAALLSPIRHSEWLGHPTLLVLQPISVRVSAAAQPRIVGFLVGRIDTRELEKLLEPPENDPDLPRLEFWLIDAERKFVAREGRIVANPGVEEVPPALSLPFGTEAGIGPALVAEATFPGVFDGAAVYAVAALDDARTGERGYLVATAPSALAFRSLSEVQRGALTIGLGLAVFLLLPLVYLAEHQVVRPILLLAEGAKRVSTGDLDVFLPVHRRDEITELTRAFNEMAQRIREGRESLEEARDELARSNEGLKAANRTLETLAITDGLTGLYNRRHFQDVLDKEIRRCEREQIEMSLLLLDIDHFKQYNDRWGHTEGDAALRRVAAQIMKSIRATDVAFRYGGEELAVLLPRCPKDQAAEVAEKIRSAVASGVQRPSRFGGKVTVSVGLATFPEDGRVARAIVEMADAALYAAKAQGRDRTVVAGNRGGLQSESAG